MTSENISLFTFLCFNPGQCSWSGWPRLKHNLSLGIRASVTGNLPLVTPKSPLWRFSKDEVPSLLGWDTHLQITVGVHSWQWVPQYLTLTRTGILGTKATSFWLSLAEHSSGLISTTRSLQAAHLKMVPRLYLPIIRDTSKSRIWSSHLQWINMRLWITLT